jgi:serine protease Do
MGSFLRHLDPLMAHEPRLPGARTALSARSSAVRSELADKAVRAPIGRFTGKGAVQSDHRLTLSMLVTLVCFLTGSGQLLRAEADVRRDATVMAIEEVMPAVVNISTETIVEIRDPMENLFRDFFGPNWGRRPQAQQSLGSGVIIDETGYILTNFHVVRRATRITVTLGNNRYEAKLIGVAHKSDVALLKLVAMINPRGAASLLPPEERFRAVKLAPDNDLLLGETVLALGNPFGLGGSVSRGILSSRTRRPSTDNEPLALDIADWLQTDAAINPGNSGGPLINLRGELIGLNVAIFREGQGIGFAIPARRISEALSEIFTPEGIKGLWLGARFTASTNGVVASLVEPGSPAERAGLRPGDRILKINDKAPKSVMELNRELISPETQQDVELLIQRGKERRSLAPQLIPEKDFFNAGLIRQKLGATLQEITPEIAANMGFSRLEGFLVAGVDNNSPAAEAGLRRGDVVQAFNGQLPQNLTQAAKQLYARKAGDRVKLNLLVRRSRGNLFNTATAEVALR